MDACAYVYALEVLRVGQMRYPGRRASTAFDTRGSGAGAGGRWRLLGRAGRLHWLPAWVYARNAVSGSVSVI